LHLGGQAGQAYLRQLVQASNRAAVHPSLQLKEHVLLRLLLLRLRRRLRLRLLLLRLLLRLLG
jgi:hypothetical protein